MTSAEPTLLDVLRAEEAELVLDRFDEVTAWELGRSLFEEVLRRGLPLAVAVRRGDRRLFHAAAPGTAALNDAWLERKTAVVDHFGHSSYLVGEQFRVEGGSFDADSRLDPRRYAAHGGAFPVLLRGTGCVGAVAVSGLPEADDHAFVTAGLRAFLARG